jgi:hypothetical protein
MSDVRIGDGKIKGKIEKMNESPFFTFSKPYLDFIGKGKIFGFVYYIMAIINLLLPFGIISTAIEKGAFRNGAKFAFAFILSWLVITFACWIGLQLWWNRRTKILNTNSSEFIATICFSDIIQTFGEWIGTMLGIIGAGVGLIVLIFLRGREGYSLFYSMGLGFMSYGPILLIICGPATGFFIIIISRFFAELLRLFASLTNNSKDIATNLQGIFLVGKKMLGNNTTPQKR